MADSLAAQLEQDLACENLLSCLHGLSELDRECFQALVESDDPLTVDELTGRVDRERSTAYRSVHRLVDAGVVRKRQRNSEAGGYYHVYRPADPDVVADDMQRQLNDWYAKMSGLIAEFRTEYGEE